MVPMDLAPQDNKGMYQEGRNLIGPSHPKNHDNETAKWICQSPLDDAFVNKCVTQ